MEGRLKKGLGNHGSISPQEIHNSLVIGGKRIKVDHATYLPSSNVDILPTVLNLLGIDIPKYLEGRALLECLDNNLNNINDEFDKLNIPHEGKAFRGSNQYLSSFDNPLITESSEFIVKSCLQYPDEKIYVCAIGCLTNIASALLMEPKIINNLIVVWTSGFPTYSINNNSHSFNLVQDVLSSQLLFECGVANVYLPGYNVGAQLTLSLPDMKEFVKGRGDIGNYLYELYTNNPLHKQRGVIDQTWRTWVIWDVITIAWMIDASWVPSHIVSSPVLNDELYWKRNNESHPMREAYGVNRDAIFHDFFTKIDKLK